MRSSDQTTTARPPALLLSFVSSAVGATTFRLGAGGPWRRATGLQQARRVGFRQGVCCSATAGQGLGGPGECVGGPQRGCRMERGTESLGNKLTCFFLQGNNKNLRPSSVPSALMNWDTSGAQCRVQTLSALSD